MPYLKKPLSLVVIALLLSLSLSSWADFEMERLNIRTTGDRLIVNIDANLSLTKDPSEALDSGIPLFIPLQIRWYKKRNFLPDKLIQQWELEYILRYHTLSGQYLLKYPLDIILKEYSTIQEAIKAIESSLDYSLVLNEAIEESEFEGYKLKVRVVLDRETLPTPLKVMAHISPSWRINSGWMTWPTSK